MTPGLPRFTDDQSRHTEAWNLKSDGTKGRDLDSWDCFFLFPTGDSNLDGEGCDGSRKDIGRGVAGLAGGRWVESGYGLLCYRALGLLLLPSAFALRLA